MLTGQKRLWVAAGVMVVVLSATSYGQSRGPIKLGALNVSPSLDLENRYDDNVLLDRRHSAKSYVGIISPGLKIALPVKSHSGTFGYRSDILRYSDEPGQRNAVHHFLQGQLNLQSRQGPALALSDVYSLSSDPPISELTGRVRYRQNTALARASVPLGHHVSVGGGYQFYATSYEDATLRPLLDRNERLAMVDLNYHVRPKVQTFFEYDRSLTAYDNASNGKDSKYDQFQGGVRGDITPKIKMILKMGGQYRRYLATGSNARTTVVTLRGEYRPDALTEINVVGDRSVVESAFENNLFYRSTRFGATLSRQVAAKWKAFLDGDASTNGYPQPRSAGGTTDQRTDNLWRLKAGASYALQPWLHAELSYQRRERYSNFDEFEYRNNLVALALRASL